MSEIVSLQDTAEPQRMLEIQRGLELIQISTEPLPDLSVYDRELLLRALPKHVADQVRIRQIEQSQPGFREESFYEDSPYPDTGALYAQRVMAASAFTALMARRLTAED
jgi:hypothetical protein